MAKVYFIATLVIFQGLFFYAQPTHFSNFCSFDNGNYNMSWMYNASTDKLYFVVEVAAAGWVGFGLASNASTGMMGYDVAVGGVSNGTGYLKDYLTVGQVQPRLDTQQDWNLTYSSEVDNVTTLKFYRMRNTSDSNDTAVQQGESIYVIWAYHYTDDVNLMTWSFNQHSKSGFENKTLIPATDPSATSATISPSQTTVVADGGGVTTTAAVGGVVNATTAAVGGVVTATTAAVGGVVTATTAAVGGVVNATTAAVGDSSATSASISPSVTTAVADGGGVTATTAAVGGGVTATTDAVVGVVTATTAAVGGGVTATTAAVGSGATATTAAVGGVVTASTAAGGGVATTASVGGEVTPSSAVGGGGLTPSSAAGGSQANPSSAAGGGGVTPTTAGNMGVMSPTPTKTTPAASSVVIDTRPGPEAILSLTVTTDCSGNKLAAFNASLQSDLLKLYISKGFPTKSVKPQNISCNSPLKGTFLLSFYAGIPSGRTIQQVFREGLKAGAFGSDITEANTVASFAFPGATITYKPKSGECDKICCNGAGGKLTVEASCTPTEKCAGIELTDKEDDGHCPGESKNTCKCSKGFHDSPSFALIIVLGLASLIKSTF